MSRSTTPYADSKTNNILKRLHNKLRPAGTPIERVEYIIELLLLRIFETKLRQDESFEPLRKLFAGEKYRLLFSHLLDINGMQILSHLNNVVFPFYASILTKARPVIEGNLTPRMQDSLVLMEEVFANSNFTNNVQGGVLYEIIGMVNEINEEHILKTDLLGDAIESALSETGGTKDFGLYRTPDHIRRMMVEMAAPNFTDTIFDPACGTAGFLFDAYDYMSEKAFENNKIPTKSVATTFHRNGVGGIEYQGRVRKMAAVNMYIRKLNPHNIQQGDSLKMYDPASDENSKSVILANPPFGAERDQPAYPNVWEEYSKESETTILFVKLMFDHLKNGGRCAVVVSDSFLNWGHSSACALRKLLLNEANLKAIISLPQGVFVSKSGQGAKTSILYFEKGKPTNFVWCYKIETDGFSMGTNRKPIEGSQIPEMLKLFEKVKCGQKPQNTQYSFCVDKKQIETLDPRIVEEIKNIVGEKTKHAFAIKHAKALGNLKKEFADKRINKAMYESKLNHFDSLMDIQTNNEIAKAIEKKYTYDFNLQSYISNLSPEQVKKWKGVCKGVKTINTTAIDKRYQELSSVNPNVALQIMASFECEDALHISIAEEYLQNIDKDILKHHEKLQELKGVLSQNFQYPIVKLEKFLQKEKERVENQNVPVWSVSNAKGFVNSSEYFSKKVASDDISNYRIINQNFFAYNPARINVGSIALNETSDIGSVSPMYVVFSVMDDVELNPKYLLYLVKSDVVNKEIKKLAQGGIRQLLRFDDLKQIKIPLPPLKVQEKIIAEIDAEQQAITECKILIAKMEQKIADKVGEIWGGKI